MPMHASAADAFVYADWLRIKHRHRASDMHFGRWVLSTYFPDIDEPVPSTAVGRMHSALTTEDAYHAFVQALMAGELCTAALSWVLSYELRSPAVDPLVAFRRVEALRRQHKAAQTYMCFGDWLLKTFYAHQLDELKDLPKVKALLQATGFSSEVRALMTCLLEGDLPAAPLLPVRLAA